MSEVGQPEGMGHAMVKGIDVNQGFACGVGIGSDDRHNHIDTFRWKMNAGMQRGFRRMICPLLLTAVIVASGGATRADTGQPGWVKEAIARETGTQYDQRASSALIYRNQQTKIDKKGRIKSHIETATRTLTHAGVGEAVARDWIGAYRKIDNLKGWLIRDDRVVMLLQKEDFVEYDLMSLGLYDDAHYIEAAIPGARPGDIAAYEYDIEEQDPVAGYIESHVFQWDQPVLFDELTIDIPRDWNLHVSAQYLEPVEYSSVGRVHRWMASDLPYRPSEPLMPKWTDLSRQLTVMCYAEDDARTGYLKDWQSVSSWAAQLEGSALCPDSSLNTCADSLCRGLDSPTAKFRAIAEYVRDEIRYVGVEIGIGRFQPRPAATTLTYRYGDCKDKAALTRALLQAVGIPSVSVLAHTEVPVDPAFPCPFSFNHAIVAVPLSALPDLGVPPVSVVDSMFFFDPTDDRIPFGLLSRELRGTRVLVADGSPDPLHQLPPLGLSDCRQIYRADLTLTSGFSFAGQVEMAYYGVPAAEQAAVFRSMTPAAFADQLRDTLAAWILNPKISDFVCLASDDSTVFRFTLSGSGVVANTGDYCLLKADVFHGDGSDELGAKQRSFPIWLGDALDGKIDIVWHLPPGYRVESLPPPVKDSCALATLDGRFSKSDSTFSYSYFVQYHGGVVPAERYAQARTFNRSLHSAYKARVSLAFK